MKIPFKIGRLKLRRRPVKFIIVHHTAELYPQPEARVDNTKYQLQGIFKGVLEKADADVNYHFVIDKIKEDYVPIACRPFVTLCDWEDIPDDINNAALHVAMLGSYDFKIPNKRIYEVMSYRLINPLLKMFKIPPSRVKLHNEVSTNEDLTCPGDFFDKETLIAMIRRYVMR